MYFWSRSLTRIRFRQVQRHVHGANPTHRAFSIAITRLQENTATTRLPETHENSQSKWTTTTSNTSPVRFAMRQLPYPIVLLTTSSGNIDRPLYDFENNDLYKNYGVILSTFNTVSMGPPAMISFNLRLPSHTWDLLQSRKLFFVNFLAASSTGAKVAEAFIRKSHDEAYKFCVDEVPGAEFSWERLRPWKLPRSDLDESAAAFVVAGEAGLASLSCALVPEKCVRVEDHIICVAEVLAVARLTDEAVQTGLIYWGGDFGSARQGWRFAEPEENQS